MQIIGVLAAPVLPLVLGVITMRNGGVPAGTWMLNVAAWVVAIRRERNSVAVVLFSMLLAGASLLRPDPLEPVAHVEGIVGMAAAHGPGPVVAAIVSLAVLPVAFLLFMERRIGIVLALYAAGLLVAAGSGNHPVPVLVISTQSASDAFIGHFASTDARNFGASHYSNEPFSSGDPLEERQCNFAKNAAYLGDDATGVHPALAAFQEDLRGVVATGDLVLRGGARGVDDHAIARPTLGDVARLQRLRSSLGARTRHLGHEIAGSHVYPTDEPENLAHFLHERLGAECVILYVNVGILRHDASDRYFGAVHGVVQAVRESFPEWMSGR